MPACRPVKVLRFVLGGRTGLRLADVVRAGLLALWLCLGGAAATAQVVNPVLELSSMEVTRGEDGLALSFAVRFELPRQVEDALLKGIPLHFVAEAELIRSRWYWRDKRITRATRTWRLAYQPLARQYRVSFGGLNQNFENLTDALAAVRRATDWKVAELREVEEGSSHYIAFSYRLDTTLLPRPMQIGISGQPEWNLRLENTVRFE
jgi:hypothetical protein